MIRVGHHDKTSEECQLPDLYINIAQSLGHQARKKPMTEGKDISKLKRTMPDERSMLCLVTLSLIIQ